MLLLEVLSFIYGEKTEDLRRGKDELRVLVNLSVNFEPLFFMDLVQSGPEVRADEEFDSFNFCLHDDCAERALTIPLRQQRLLDPGNLPR